MLGTSSSVMGTSMVGALEASCSTQYLRIFPRSTVISASASANGAATMMCAASPTTYVVLSALSAIEVLLETPQSVKPGPLESMEMAVRATLPAASFPVTAITYSPPVEGVKVTTALPLASAVSGCVLTTVSCGTACQFDAPFVPCTSLLL